MKMSNTSILKIRKVGPGWLWQMLGPAGRAMCTAVDIKKSPQLALENAAAMFSYVQGGPVIVPDCPPVGQTTKYHGWLKIWRQS